MDLLKNIGKVIIIAILSSQIFGLLVAFVTSLISQTDEFGNEYEAVVYGFIAMIPGAVIGLIYGIHKVFLKK